ncbi:MAG: hypothetical protein AABX17_00375 [Nanoarchaeota archaeon]
MEERKDRILFAEDDEEYIKPYQVSLEKVGFEVRHVSDGALIVRILEEMGKDYFDVILSDTNLDFVKGPMGIRRALKKCLLDDSRTLIIGMSNDSNNQRYWRGLAHLGCFYDKDYFPKDIIGEKVARDLRNFRSGGEWKNKMPRIQW